MGSNVKHATFSLELDIANDTAKKFSDEIESLKKDLLKADRSVEILRKREKLSAEEAGEGLLMNVLEVTLNPVVLGLLIKVVHDWFRYKTSIQKRPFKLTIKTEKGEFTIDTERDVNVDELFKEANKIVGNGGK